MSKADAIRRKYLYRRLIMQRRLQVSNGAARALVGPDCAYHLYGQLSGTAQPEAEASDAEHDLAARREDEG